MPLYKINNLLDYNYKNENNLKTINKKSKDYQDHINKYNLMKQKIIIKMAENINEKFIERLCNDKLNKILVHSMDTNINSDITSIIVYRKYNKKSNVRLIVLLMAVNPKLRNYGYGNALLNEFIDFHSKKSNQLDIFLHSLTTSLYFYLKYGFKRITINKFLQSYEGWENDKNDEKLLLHFRIILTYDN
jgi:N-acetylglutamate synthase-like GNAT family acetyltransferase